jgi:hypothetical protein
VALEPNAHVSVAGLDVAIRPLDGIRYLHRLGGRSAVLASPNVKQRFWVTLRGAVLAVGCWIGMSYLLGVYFGAFANFNKTYGTHSALL